MIETAREMQMLFTEVVALFHRLKAVAAELHGEAGVTAAMRGVLNQLDGEGETTVPRMARRRPVSRQHIQNVVNRLLERDLVRYEENPDHRRSKLVKLTPDGLRLVRQMRDREASLLGHFKSAQGPDALRSTAQVLAEVRRWFETSNWQNEANKHQNKNGATDAD